MLKKIQRKKTKKKTCQVNPTSKEKQATIKKQNKMKSSSPSGHHLPKSSLVAAMPKKSDLDSDDSDDNDSKDSFEMRKKSNRNRYVDDDDDDQMSDSENDKKLPAKPIQKKPSSNQHNPNKDYDPKNQA